MRLFHLSHTDLDGYSCQFITSLYFNNRYYFNSGYGKEIDVRLDSMISNIVELGDDDRYFFLITDLNLDEKQSQKLNKEIERLKNSGFDIKLLLLDHHITGEEMSKEYDWYILDNSRCATKMTYDYFSKEKWQSNIEKSSIISFVKAVNAIDIWLEDDSLFEVGKVCMRMISESKELNRIMFSDYNTIYKLYCIEKILPLIPLDNSHIVLDEKIHFIKKDFFKQDGKNNSIDNLVSKYIVNILSKQKGKITIKYMDKIGILTFGLQGVSVMANQFLKENDDIDFFMNISANAMVSLRSSNKIDVSKMAKNLFDGGGHINASGGKMKIKINHHSYQTIKETVVKFIDDKLQLS